ncbi:hypothetical protein FISHEDRAFT_70242 [Fistulina hepatica ATCC 64428]|uniref:DUF5745 domain-containing protein n=1 Tax=Fistulina hepatica ATCC 64428 TaxID=1128425 RepID=A0A0D7AK85_9AGAR|nr:hypothetical protein FISHEDRAFT_70242 [Fistulina hepatica ATCC 64428]
MVPAASTAQSASLVRRMNALLEQIHIPLSIISPTELTPSLLFATLESVLRMRIPIPASTRKDLFSPQGSQKTKFQCMKLFLGVLETDVLKMDVGLDGVDPFRLVRGELDECVYIGELLCWVGETIDLLVASHGDEDRVELAGEIQYLAEQSAFLADLSASLVDPSGCLADNAQAFANESASFSSTSPSHPFSANTTATTNTTMTTRSSKLAGSTASTQPTSTSTARLEWDTFFSNSDLEFGRRDAPTLRCIHEVPSPSIVLSPCIRPHELDDEGADTTPTIDSSGASSEFSYCTCTGSIHLSPSRHHAASVPVRHTGVISPVDEDAELRSFDDSRASLRLDASRSSCDKSCVASASARPADVDRRMGTGFAADPSEIFPTSESSQARTLTLMTERARLKQALVDVLADPAEACPSSCPLPSVTTYSSGHVAQVGRARRRASMSHEAVSNMDSQRNLGAPLAEPSPPVLSPLQGVGDLRPTLLSELPTTPTNGPRDQQRLNRDAGRRRSTTLNYGSYESSRP